MNQEVKAHAPHDTGWGSGLLSRLSNRLYGSLIISKTC